LSRVKNAMDSKFSGWFWTTLTAQKTVLTAERKANLLQSSFSLRPVDMNAANTAMRNAAPEAHANPKDASVISSIDAVFMTHSR